MYITVNALEFTHFFSLCTSGGHTHNGSNIIVQTVDERKHTTRAKRI